VELQMAAKEQQRNGQVPAAVTAKLQSLISGHVVEANDFDSHSLRQELLCMTNLPTQTSRLTWCRIATLHVSRSGHDLAALPLKMNRLVPAERWQHCQSERRLLC
jgi:hypothetical protein